MKKQRKSRGKARDSIYVLFKVVAAFFALFLAACEEYLSTECFKTACFSKLFFAVDFFCFCFN